MDRRGLWHSVESHLDSSLLGWRDRAAGFRQLVAVDDRNAGRTWSDDEVFQALVMAVLSANTDWSRIERVQDELSDLFKGFNLESYAALSETEVDDCILPWFTERKASAVALRKNLGNLVGAARILVRYRTTCGRPVDHFFTSLVGRCDGDAKQAALRLGSDGDYKLPSLGVPLAAEALKNLGFDVAKPDQHVMRAVGSFGLVHFGRWSDERDLRNGRESPVPTPKRQRLAMSAVEEIADAAGQRVVLVDNAIWLLCAKSGLYLTNQQLAKMVRENGLPNNHVERLDALIRSWLSEEDPDEQRETLEHLVRALNEDRRLDRKLFPEELKGKSW